MHDREIAHRIVNYADAVVAVDFLSVTAFGLAAADPDILCSIASAKALILTCNAVVAVSFSVCLYFLRRWELDLSAGEPLSPKGEKYARYLHIARFCVIWLSLVIMNLVVVMTSRTGCEI
jgi:hypothetical protein